jgi:hypothetical protein
MREHDEVEGAENRKEQRGPTLLHLKITFLE